MAEEKRKRRKRRSTSKKEKDNDHHDADTNLDTRSQKLDGDSNTEMEQDKSDKENGKKIELDDAEKDQDVDDDVDDAEEEATGKIQRKRKNSDVAPSGSIGVTDGESGADMDYQNDSGAVDTEKDKDNEDEKMETTGKRKRKRKRKKKDACDTQGEGSGGVLDLSASREKLSSLEHMVYVEGIPFECQSDDVKEFFVGNGCADILEMRLPRWQDTGRLRGYGHIVFNTTESRNKAISDLNGLNLRRRYLSIQAPKPPRPGTTAAAAKPSSTRAQPEGCRKIFVKNLPYDADEDEIAETFRSCGKIVDGGVRIARNHTNNLSKGFAYVEFKNPEGAYAAAQRAAKAFGITIKGRPCFVDYEEGNMKGSYRTGDGKLWQKEHGNVYGSGEASKGYRNR